jgi:ketosteroid isomerase-like protein
MRKLIIASLLIAGIASCNKPAAPVVDTAGEQNKEVAKRYADAGAKGDTTALEAILADNVMLYGPGLNDSTTKAKDVSFWKNGWKNDWQSMDYNRAALVAFTIPADGKFPGDWVSDWGKWTVKEKNGKTVSFWWNGVFRVKDGKIDLGRTFFNVNDFFEQEGYTVTPPAAPKEEKKK